MALMQWVPYMEDMSDVEVLAPGSQCEVATPGEGLPEHPQQPGGLQPRHCGTAGVTILSIGRPEGTPKFLGNFEI